MIRTISLGITLYTIWLLFSGHYSSLLLSLGFVSCLVVIYLSHRMQVIDTEGHPIQLSPRIFLYLPWLIFKIIQANLDVSKQILSPRTKLSPVQFKVPCSLQSDLGRVVYANSITLTPGTLTLDTADDSIEVHALSEAAAHELLAGEMEKRVNNVMRGR